MAWNISALALTAFLINGQENPEHLVERRPDSHGPTTAPMSLSRLNALADRLRSNGQAAPRLGIFDVAWPSSSIESDAAGRNGILQVTVVVADRAELPVTAYAHIGDRNVRLELLTRSDSTTPSGTSIRDVGSFEEQAHYLLPLDLAAKPGAIVLDFSTHRTGFQLGALPLDPPQSITGSVTHGPDNRAVEAFLKREFPEAPPITGAR
jgi:hypothetical protein